jgi:hypothetical protein
MRLHDVLQTITYDRADGIHHVVGVIQSKTMHMADHGIIAFPIPKHLGLWDDNIANDATVAKMKKAEATNKACAKDYGIFKAVEEGYKKLLAWQWRGCTLLKRSMAPHHSTRFFCATSATTSKSTRQG